MKKFDSYKKALARLDESIEKLEINDNDVMRDGVIQRFEFTMELAWKTLKEYLENRGFGDVKTPRDALKTAYEIDLIEDELLWIDMLKVRNLTSHIYDENTVIEISDRIRAEFVPLFHKLQDNLNKLIKNN